MLALRAARSGVGRVSPPRSSIVAAANKGYATVAQEVSEPAASLYDQKVDMSPMEKGKQYYLNYKRIADNLKIVRGR